MFFIYQILFTLLILVSPLIILFRVLKGKEDKKRFLEKFFVTSKKRGKGKLIWFHGSSVGEIMSIIPLVHYYEKNKSINKILITSSTLSSSKILHKFNLKKTTHQFYPLDHLFITKKFICYWKPSIAIFIDSEIWPAMFKTVDKNKIPLILLNARITNKTFKRWITFKNFSNSIFNRISSAYPQNKETEFYLKKLKPNNINSLGNLKFIKNNLDKDNLDNLDIQFKNYKVWVAASTHKGEEIFCAKAHIELKKKNKKLITVIIPRHINRVNEIVSEMNKLNLKTAIHNSRVKNLEDIDIYIVNTFGESKKFYKIATTVFLGKSLAIKGGQNPLEAIHYGAKILHGPYVDNFKDVYKLLKSLGASKKIKTINQLVLNISFKKNKMIGNKIKKTGKIIFKKTINEINKFIINEF
jgi:3-deoxy-D-manno-octulosonic-acid transferase